MANYCRAGWLLIIMLFIFATGHSQRISNQQYTPVFWDNTSGLPVNSVFKVRQDSLGYIWILTEEGMLSFDGLDFRTYNQETVPELHSTWFNDFTLASEGSIWAATANSIVHINKSNIKTIDARKEADGTKIISLKEDQEGTLWVGTANGRLYKLLNGVLDPVTHWDKGLGSIRAIEKTPDGMAFGTEQGLVLYNAKSDKFKPVKGLEGVEVRSLTMHPDGALWIGTWTSGIYYLRDEKLNAINTDHHLTSNHINAIHITTSGEVWVGMAIGGVQVIKDHKVISFSEPEFGFNEVRDIYVSDDGIVWLAVVGKGVIEMIPSAIRTLGKSDGLSMDICLAIFQDKNNFAWVGTAGGGVNRINMNIPLEVTHVKEISAGVKLTLFGVDDYIYVGSAEGLERYDINKKKVDRKFSQNDGLVNNIVQIVYQDSKKRTWIATRSGGLYFLHNHERIEKLNIPPAFKNADFISIMEDKKGNIWLGTNSTGMLKITPNGQMQTLQIHDAPSSDMVLSFYEDPDGDIWIGTDKALMVLQNGAFRALGQESGLRPNAIFRIIEDDYNNIWTSGNFGLQRIALNELIEWKNDPSGNTIINVQQFDDSDGMANREANGAIFPAGWKMTNGDIWFPTMEGVAIVSPGELQDVNKSVGVHINSIDYADKEIDPSKQSVVIPAGVHNLEVHFGSFDFRNPKTIKYYYRLSNLDKDWISVGNRRIAYFTNLTPGNYTFEVQAEQFGKLSEIASFSFKVLPFFYQTLWFKTLVLIATILLGFFISRFYLKARLSRNLETQIQLKTEELQVRNKLLEKALGDIERQNSILKEVAWVQSHELRGPLSRMLGLVMVANDFDNYKNIKWSKKQLLEEMSQSAIEMDEILRKLNTQIETIEENNE